MMKKGKGYPEHVKNTDKSFGDPFAQDVTGGRNIRSSLNKWDDVSWKASDKGAKQKQWKFGMRSLRNLIKRLITLDLL